MPSCTWSLPVTPSSDVVLIRCAYCWNTCCQHTRLTNPVSSSSVTNTTPDAARIRPVVSAQLVAQRRQRVAACRVRRCVVVPEDLVKLGQPFESDPRLT